LRSLRSFKVIEVSTDRVCDFLLVINSNWHLISYTVSELSQLIVQISDTLRFWSTFFGGRSG